MLLAPLNFVYSLQVVPIFQWEPVESADGAAAQPTATACDGTGSDAPQRSLDLDTSVPSMRLVFKGFGWAPAADCVTLPRPNWESCYAGGSDEANDHPDRDRNAQLDASRRVKPASTVHHAPPTGLHGPEPGTDTPDTSSEST